MSNSKFFLFSRNICDKSFLHKRNFNHYKIVDNNQYLIFTIHSNDNDKKRTKIWHRYFYWTRTNVLHQLIYTVKNHLDKLTLWERISYMISKQSISFLTMYFPNVKVQKMVSSQPFRAGVSFAVQKIMISPHIQFKRLWFQCMHSSLKIYFCCQKVHD